MPMKIHRFVITLLISLLSYSSFGQLRPVLYGGVDYYRNTGFLSNSHANVQVGTQLFKWRFLAPEVGFEYDFGSPNAREQLNPEDPNARPPSKLESRFSSRTFTIAPKIIIGNKEAAIVLLPQYNIGKISARGDLLKDTGNRYVLEEQQRVSEATDFWSFAAGIEGQFWESDILNFSLLLKYSLLDSEEILEQINVGEPALNSPGGSAGGLGLTFRVYFDLMELLQK